MAVGPQNSVLAPRFARVVCVAVVAVCAVTAVSLVQYGRLEVLLRAMPAVLLAAALAYVVFWRPRVLITPERIEAVNPFRTLIAPWAAVTGVTAHWSLSVRTDAGAFAVWAAPAQSPWSAVGELRRDALGRPSMGRSASGTGVATTSIAPLVEQQWAAHRDAPGSQGAAVIHRNVPAVTVIVTLALLTLAGIAWP